MKFKKSIFNFGEDQSAKEMQSMREFICLI